MYMDQLPNDFYPLVRRMLRLPESEVNMLDIASRSIRIGQGEVLKKLTMDDINVRRYLVGTQVTRRSDYARVIPNEVIISTQAKVTLASFPLIFVAPPVTDLVASEYSLRDTHIRLPDFRSRAKRNLILRKTEKVVSDDTMSIDIEVEETPEEKEKRAQKEAEELEKEVLTLQKAEYRRINEMDFENSSQRNEIAYVQQTYKLLAPHGVMLFLTHRQLMEKAFLQYVQSSFYDVEFLAVPDDPNNRVLIIGKRRDKKAKLDTSVANEWLRYRYGTEEEPMPELGMSDTQYVVPPIPIDALLQFRIGPITTEEIAALMATDSLVERVTSQEMRLPVYEPIAPAPLHKGHLVQLLTSGMMDSYIGEGKEQHLVKGSSVRLANTTVEETEEGEDTTVRDYYTVNLKLLLPDGTFRRVR